MSTGLLSDEEKGELGAGESEQSQLPRTAVAVVTEAAKEVLKTAAQSATGRKVSRALRVQSYGDWQSQR